MVCTKAGVISKPIDYFRPVYRIIESHPDQSVSVALALLVKRLTQLESEVHALKSSEHENEDVMETEEKRPKKVILIGNDTKLLS